MKRRARFYIRENPSQSSPLHPHHKYRALFPLASLVVPPFVLIIKQIKDSRKIIFSNFYLKTALPDESCLKCFCARC